MANSQDLQQQVDNEPDEYSTSSGNPLLGVVQPVTSNPLVPGAPVVPRMVYNPAPGFRLPAEAQGGTPQPMPALPISDPGGPAGAPGMPGAPLTPEQVREKVLLRIRAGESSLGDDAWGMMYGGGTAPNLQDHPRRYAPIMDANGQWTGKYSSAAGAYQFIGSTWDRQARKLGLKDFSSESQSTAAWDLAQTTYKRNTGRDLVADAQTGKVEWPALGSEWESLKNSSAGGLDLPDGVGRRGSGNSRMAAGGAGDLGPEAMSPTGGLEGSQRAQQALMLMRLMAPKHEFQPVAYDPWKLMPKVGSA